MRCVCGTVCSEHLSTRRTTHAVSGIRCWRCAPNLWHGPCCGVAWSWARLCRVIVFLDLFRGLQGFVTSCGHLSAVAQGEPALGCLLCFHFWWVCFSLKETLAGFFGSVALDLRWFQGFVVLVVSCVFFYQQKCSWSAGSFSEKPTAVVPHFLVFPRRTTGGKQNVGPNCLEVYLANAVFIDESTSGTATSQGAHVVIVTP